MTEMTDFQRKISTLLPDFSLSFNEPLKNHTSFRIGGPAEVMVTPKSVQELSRILEVSAVLDTKPYILGAGTNILMPDEGLKGLTVCLKDGLDDLALLDETHIAVGAGVTMTKAAVFAANHGLSGMEFAHGIPGTVGGGVYMNAGAYGGEIQDICQCVDVLDTKGILRTFTKEEMAFSYRHSRLETEGGIVVGAVFALVKKPVEEIKARMQELMAKRKASQPLDKPSAGSAFKRPVGGYAAALIDGAGLKGYQVGGAAVSEKHAGFVVNLKDATAADVRKVLQEVSDIVFEKTGIRLEPEVRIW